MPEVVAVMVIVGTLAAVAMPRFGAAQENRRAWLAAARFRGMLERAAIAAEATGRPWRIAIAPDDRLASMESLGTDGTWELAESIHFDRQPFAIRLIEVETKPSVSPAAVTFDGYGDPDVALRVRFHAGGAPIAVVLNPDQARPALTR